VNFLLTILLFFQITPISSRLSIIGTDFLFLLPDSETDIFLNPANIFFWDKKLLLSLSSYANDFSQENVNLPVTFQNRLHFKVSKSNYAGLLGFQYFFVYEKASEKSFFLNRSNFPFLIGYDWGERKIGFLFSYQWSYRESKDSGQAAMRAKEVYFPLKVGLASGEEQKLEIIFDFVPYRKEDLKSYQFNFLIKENLGEIPQHHFLLGVNYQKENQIFQFFSGYCLASAYNFYGLVFNTYLGLKPIFSFFKKNWEAKILFPSGLNFSFGKIKILFGFKNELVKTKKDVYLSEYDYNFGFGYHFTNNLEFYFFNLSFASFRKWFFDFKITF
jgi:outer membrane receptor protein involved in Fe transport